MVGIMKINRRDQIFNAMLKDIEIYINKEWDEFSKKCEYKYKISNKRCSRGDSINHICRQDLCPIFRKIEVNTNDN